MMILCLDVGNSNIFGGVFSGKKIQLRFRHETKQASTSDQFGLFLKAVLKENNIDATKITRIGISSVVPNLDYSLASACIKYFNTEPFLLQAGVKTGLKLKTIHPGELGADIIATAIAGVEQFPQRNLVVVDLGTATTFTAINDKKELLGIVIQAGMRVSMLALQSHTAKLPAVRILRPEETLGRATAISIQSGLYYGHLGSMKEIIRNISKEVFADDHPIVIGTGGFSHLFEPEKLFTLIEPDLVLHGIRLALEMNA
jgi:type III pantothenate kinase